MLTLLPDHKTLDVLFAFKHTNKLDQFFSALREIGKMNLMSIKFLFLKIKIFFVFTETWTVCILLIFSFLTVVNECVNDHQRMMENSNYNSNYNIIDFDVLCCVSHID